MKENLQFSQPLEIFTKIIIIITSLLCLNSNSWMNIWVTMEMNTFSFSFYLSKHQESKNMALVYFSIQSILSISLIITNLKINSSISNEKIKEIMNFNLTTFLISIMKMGLIPNHKWLIHISKKIPWSPFIYLSTIQKIIPLNLISKTQMNPISLSIMILNMILTPPMIFSNNNPKTIMAGSSIFNLSWISLTALTNKNISMVIMLMYSLSTILMMTSLKKNLNSHTNNKSTKTDLMINIINMTGMPPLPIFSSKTLFLKMMSKQVYNKTVVLVFLISSWMMAYIYMKMMFSLLMSSKNKFSKKLELSSSMLILSACLMFFL